MLKDYLKNKGIKALLIILIALSFVESYFNTNITLWLTSIFDAVNNKQDFTDTAIMLAIGLVVNNVIGFVIRILNKNAYDLSYTKFVGKLAKKLSDCDYDIFSKYDSGFINSLMSGCSRISKLGDIIISIMSNMIYFIMLVIVISKKNTTIVIVIVPVYIIGAFIIKRLWKKSDVIQSEIENFVIKRSSEMNNILNGFEEVRSNGMEKYHLDKIEYYSRKCQSLFRKKIVVTGYSTMVFSLIDTIITVGLLISGIILIRREIMSPAEAMSMIMLGWRLITPLGSILDNMDTITETNSKYKKYIEFVSIKNKVINGTKILYKFKDSIVLNNVSFAYYDNNDVILNAINLQIRKGQKIGICGPSGAGKSTILKLLCRYYDVSTGSIVIDNRNIKEYDLNSLRSHFGVISQRTYIFDGTILDNIVYGTSLMEKPFEEIEDEIVNACKKAAIYDFINGLEEGVMTQVGASGLKLSGGQKQRISLARIFLRDPEIILLDEATAALDNESEAIVQESLKLFDDKTIVTIAHRLSTIKDSDMIYVIANHKVEESGTHEALLNKDGLYKRLYDLTK